MLQRDPPAAGTPKPDGKAKAEQKKEWADAGPFGDKLYELISTDLSTEKLAGMGLPALLEAIKGGYEGDSGWSKTAAQGFLDSDDGKKLVEKSQKWVNEHPKVIYWSLVGLVASAIGTALALYFTNNIDPPEFKKKFEALGMSIEPGIDLGKFQEKVLQSASLAVTFGKKGPTLSGSVKSEGNKFGYTLGVKLGGEAAGLEGSYEQAGDGKEKGSVGGHVKQGPFTLKTKLTLNDDGTSSLDTTGLLEVQKGLSYNLSGVGGIGTNAKDKPLTFKLFPSYKTTVEGGSAGVTLDGQGGLTHFDLTQTKSLWGNQFSYGMGVGAGGAVESASASMKRDAFKAELKYAAGKEGKDGKPGTEDTLGASAEYKGGGAEVGFSANFGLDTEKLQKLTTHLGFSNEKETLKFLSDLSVEVAGGKVTASTKVAIQGVIDNWALKLEGNLSVKPQEKGGDQTTGGAGAMAYTGVGKSNFLLGGSVAGGVGAGGTPFVSPALLAGHKSVPVMLQVGATVNVGQDVSAVPMIGLVGRWDIGGGKKKK